MYVQNEQYKNNQKDEVFEEYYQSGELKVKGAYINNKKEGILTQYYKIGGIA